MDKSARQEKTQEKPQRTLLLCLPDTSALLLVEYIWLQSRYFVGLILNS